MAFEYVKGGRTLVKVPLDASSADLVQGQAVTASGATDGYFKEVDALAEAVTGIVVTSVDSPAADGGAYALIDISRESVFRVAPDAGSLVVTDNMNTCDVGADGLSINRDGSTTDDIEIIQIDTDANVAYVRINPSLSGVA